MFLADKQMQNFLRNTYFSLNYKKESKIMVDLRSLYDAIKYNAAS